MTDHEDIDMLAAEYVLGTLDAAERAGVALRRRSDRRLDEAIAAWEQRLAPLAEACTPVEPPADLLRRIEARLDAAGAANPVSASVIDLEQRVRRWRWATAAASAAAAALLAILGARELAGRHGPMNYVAVFQKDDASPSFLLTIDLTTRTLTIRPVAAEHRPGKSYELWIVPAPGRPPRSLGLIAERGFSTQAVLAAYHPSVVESATFGVSLEPAGGSPTGQPTGDVLHAKLIKTVP